MTATLEGGEWSAARPSRPLTPGKTRYPMYRRLGGPPGLVWTGGKSRPHRDSIPDRPARSQSLYYICTYRKIYAWILCCSYSWTYVIILCINLTNALVYTYMLTPLYSHCYTATCFSPEGTILREYWYSSWTGSTKYMSRHKYQITEQFVCPPVGWNWPVLI